MRVQVRYRLCPECQTPVETAELCESVAGPSVVFDPCRHQVPISSITSLTPDASKEGA